MALHKLRRFFDGLGETFTCDEVRDRQVEWKREFRENNGTDQILGAGLEDKHYMRFCEEIDTFLDTCDCHIISSTCDKCALEQHEGQFCRCESRNIKLAKQLRSSGDTNGWSKN